MNIKSIKILTCNLVTRVTVLMPIALLNKIYYNVTHIVFQLSWKHLKFNVIKAKIGRSQNS